MISLSASLRQQLRPGFFRPLSRASWPAYVDAADRLLESADEGGELSREDTITLIREIVGTHPELDFDLDEGAGFSDTRQKAGQLFNRMIEAGWLHERTVTLGASTVLVTPALRWTIRLLRELGKSEETDFKDFAATLRSLCRDLLEPPALDAAALDPEAMRQAVRDLLARATQAGDQMHAVEALILREEEAQRSTNSAAETLSRFLVDFHIGDHMVCYDALQEGGLIPKLFAARRVVQEAASNRQVKQRLAEGLNKSSDHSLATTDAFYVEAEKLLGKLEKALANLPIKQRMIDGRMADFSRLSAQRYRYQTEMRGHRPEQVKAFMDTAAILHEGKRFLDMEREPGMTILAPSVALRFGMESLASIRRARPTVSLQIDRPEDEADSLDAKDAIRRHNLLVIAPQRATRFFEQRKIAPGVSLSTGELHDLPEDDWLDLLAVLAFDRSQQSGSHRPLKWEIQTPRQDEGVHPETIPTDSLSGRRLERVTITRIL